jgi:succinyl-diaminopimelate desuccinylase
MKHPDVDSIVELARQLIAIPSQGGIDRPDPVIDTVEGWLAEHGIAPVRLRDGSGVVVGICADIGSGSGPRYCLNACLDTAPFGDPRHWTSSPTGGEVRDGWLTGRGAADCKTAVAMFAHLGAELVAQADELAGTLTLLFDADEHTGHFGGARAYMADQPRPDGVMIGYPGLDEIVTGARGFWRATVEVFGRAAHSGSRRRAVDNAIVKASRLVRLLTDADSGLEADGTFPVGPKATVTAISGGTGYSVVPDRCAVSVDVRLTPRFDDRWADELVRGFCRSLDDAMPSRLPTLIVPDSTWPAYRLPAVSKLASALQEGAGQSLGRSLPLTVAGPSNIGNYLASFGVEATCGFGVVYRNLHAADESVEVASIAKVYEAYRAAVGRLLLNDQGL